MPKKKQEETFREKKNMGRPTTKGIKEALWVSCTICTLTGERRGPPSWDVLYSHILIKGFDLSQPWSFCFIRRYIYSKCFIAFKSRTMCTAEFLASRFSKIDPILIDFDELLSQKTGKKWVRSMLFSPFFRFPMPLTEANLCLHKKHLCASRGSKKENEKLVISFLNCASRD